MFFLLFFLETLSLFQKQSIFLFFHGLLAIKLSCEPTPHIDL